MTLASPRPIPATSYSLVSMQPSAYSNVKHTFPPDAAPFEPVALGAAAEPRSLAVSILYECEGDKREAVNIAVGS